MTGTVEFLAVVAEASAPMQARESVLAIAGKGLEGDRYATGIGFYSDWPAPGGGRALTLIEAEVLAWLQAQHGISLGMNEHRRNVTTRGIALNDLIGKRFSIGEVLCEGVRLCEPCVHLAQLAHKPVAGPLVHRGGLRANILRGGIIRVGDPVVETPSPVLKSAGERGSSRPA